MKPLPESAEADELYGPFIYEDADLLQRLVRLGDEVQAISPDCVGLSLSLNEHGVPFTVAATGADAALFDAVQYVEGGPCVDSAATGTVIAHNDVDPLDEQSWASFAASLSTSGVRSSLSLPVRRDGVVIGSFNLYGASTTTFDDRHVELARVLGAWAEGAVSNADLDFTTREMARKAPEVLRESTRLALAAALLAKGQDLTVETAEDRLRTAAARAGVTLPALVEAMIAALATT